MQASAIIQLNDESFSKAICSGRYLVDFYRVVGCRYCQMLEPVLEELAAELQNELKIAKVDVFGSPKTTSELQVTSVPTLILFEDGKPLKRLIGLQDLNALREFCGR